nr:reverse transcriptase domain-containing protein [Tanacetum cinerariifolium]
MADDQPMWGNNQTVAPTPGAAIVAVDLGDNFTVKGHHLSMIKDRQFDERSRADPHKHITKFVEVCGMFRYGDSNVDAIKLKLFPSSLAGEAKIWFNELKPENKAKTLRKVVAFAESDENSPLLEKMEALTTRIDSQFKEIIGHMKEMRDGSNKYRGTHPSSDSTINIWEDPRRKKQTMHLEDIEEIENPPFPRLPEKRPDESEFKKTMREFVIAQKTANDFVKNQFYNLKTKVEQGKKNHQAAIQDLETKFGMPNYGKFLKDLVSYKSKMEQISAAFLTEECSAILQKKTPSKLGDPRSFLIPCKLANSVEYLVLADLDASINLIPYSLYTALSGTTLKPTRMKKISETPLDKEFNEFMSENVQEDEVKDDFEELPPKDELRIMTSIQDPLTNLEMKPLPKHLKYAFLEEIFFSQISHSFCKHKINFEEDVKLIIQRQCRLNPDMKEVVKKEIIKLLDAGIIYAIEDSPWDSVFNFDEECNKAFETLKEKLTNAPIMVSPNWSLPFELICDANNFAVGAVLGQHEEKHFQPIHYASKTLNNVQKNYTVPEKELLVVVFAFDKFRSYLVLSKTVVFMDYAAIKYLFSKQDAKPPLIRCILLLQELDIEIKNKKGAENVTTDHLSRLEKPNLKELKDEEINDEFPDEFLMSIKDEEESP